LYADLDAERRRGEHRRIGEAIEASGAAVDELAFHFWRGDDRDKALRYSLAAGEAARRAHANEIGIEHLENALSLLDDEGRRGEVGLRVIEKLAGMETVAGSFASARKRYESLLAARQDPFARARLQRKLGELESYAGRLHEAVDTLWHAIELLGGRRPSGATSSVLHQLGALIHHVAHRLVGVLRPAPTPESAARLRELCLAY